MARSQKSSQNLNQLLVNGHEIYMIVVLYAYQINLEHIHRFIVSTLVAKVIIIQSV